MSKDRQVGNDRGFLDGSEGTTRRGFLRRTGWASLALSGLAVGGSASLTGVASPAYGSTRRAYNARKTFDDWDREFHEQDGAGQPDQPNDTSVPSGSGALAWGQSYVLLGLIRMYQAYRDPYYLDRFIDNADLVLSVRDSERGVTDYRGESLPAWRANHPYTVGAVELADAQGRKTLEVRMGDVYCDSATVTVIPGSGPDSFNLHVVHGYYGRRQTFEDLSMDPASPNYAVGRLYDAYPGVVRITARDLRPAPTAADNPGEGEYRMASLPRIFPVHTGMITYPIAKFIRIVQSSPSLWTDPRYRAKASEYLGAVRDAVEVHDNEWRENDDGEGYLLYVKGSPQQWDGCELPINRSLGLGQTLTELAAVTGDDTYRHRVSALAMMFRRQLAVDSGNAYTWRYWPTYGQVYNGYQKTGSTDTDVSLYTPTAGPGRQYEDISHAAIEIEFAVRVFRDHLGLVGKDMTRLAKTFTQNLATSRDGAATTWMAVNGTRGPNIAYAHQAPRWMPVGWWDRDIYAHSLGVYDNYRPTPEKIAEERNGFGWLLATVAHFNWYAQRGTD